jgi:hemerythrin
MDCFAWDVALGTGNELIDEQHRGLFALANSVCETAAENGEDADLVADAIYRLTEYVVQHFADEEALMIQTDYPSFSIHRGLHQHLAAETLSLAARYFNDDDVRPEEIARFLADWLRDHIRSEDIPAAAHIRSRAASTE